jgi:hypothetical protein
LKSEKASFLQLVQGCLDPKLITKEKVRSFNKRARSYMCAYYAFEQTKKHINNNDNDNDNETIAHDEMALLSCTIAYEKIEQMVKKFRTHHCVFNFDRKFFDAHVNEIKIEAKKRGRSALAASS